MNDKVFLNGQIYDVITPQEYNNNPNIYDVSETCIKVGGYVFPIRNGRYDDNKIGYYPGSPISKFCFPTTNEEKNIYSEDHVVNFQNISNIRDMVSAQNQIDTEQMMYLTSSDNIFKPNIDPVNDHPLMIAFKQAVINKKIDINRYASRFGKDFNNDRRQFARNHISLGKFISMADKLDMKVTVIIEDKNENVPNPMGSSITVDLIGDVEGSDDSNV